MRSHWKRVLLELVAGLLGWVWIVALVAGIYFLVTALVFNGPWSRLFWAFGSALTAQWLWSICLRALGTTPVAQRLWPGLFWHLHLFAALRQANRRAQRAKQVLDEAMDLVEKYGAVVERSNLIAFLRPETELPASKERIKDALVTVARYCRAIGAPWQKIELLRSGYSMLAFFVSAEDAEDANCLLNILLSFFPDPRDLSKLREIELELARKIVEADERISRGREVRQRVGGEVLRLAAEFDERVGAREDPSGRKLVDRGQW